MHVAIITAGGAGMFCGSCMHDNTLAKALQDRGTDVSLIPTYTPIRVDEENQSTDRVFFGGINVYLEHRFRLWRWLPRWTTRWLDNPRVLNWATRKAVDNNAQNLGSLTVSMLDGESGPQAIQVDELARFLGTELKPDVIVFSNALLAGALKRLKEEFAGPVYCILQGDDIFLDGLQEPFRQQAIERVFERGQQFDGLIVHSEFYKRAMSEMLGFSPDQFECIPLGIDVDSHDGQPLGPLTHDGNPDSVKPIRVGYFARICPEKGLHQLVQAFQRIHQKYPHVKLVAGGYLGPRDADYFERVKRDAVSLGNQFEYIGSPKDHPAKVAFLKSLDVFSVPTTYQEPKGISILEAQANGIPVIQPAHGSFVEMLETTKGGLLFEPGNIDELATKLEQLICDEALRYSLGQQGHAAVRQSYSLAAMTDRCLTLFEAKIAKT
jgi:glycosyltransferase involved in cell wall biosynthesis